MKFSKPIIVALAAAPAVVQGWSLRPSYFPLPTLFFDTPTTTSIIQRQRELMQRMFDMQPGVVSPRYELVDDNEKFQLSVDVPGVREEDIEIKLDEGFLTVQGHREATSETSSFSSKFSQTFSIDPTVDVEKFTATLNNGVLVVSAPKDMKKLEENVRRIPITAAADAAKTIPKLETAQDEVKKEDKRVHIPVTHTNVEAKDYQEG